MAARLAQSLKQWHAEAQVCLVTDRACDHAVFDYVEILPHGDLGGFANDWQVWSASPFRETVKLEADMLVTSPIDHWWTMLRHRDVVISTGCRNFYDEVSESRFYRAVIDNNNLPDVYNAVTYWRVSETALNFWRWIRTIFENWDQFKTLLKFPPQDPDTDLVYAMTAQIMGAELVTMPFASYPKIVHMKKHIIGTHSLRWPQELIWQFHDRGLSINAIRQWGCFHYHDKSWLANAQ